MPFKIKKLTESNIQAIKLDHGKFYERDYRIDNLDVGCSWVIDESTESYVLMLPSMVREECERFLVFYNGGLFKVDSNVAALEFAFQNLPGHLEQFREGVISFISDVFLLYGIFLVDSKGDSKDLDAERDLQSVNKVWPVSKSNFLDDGFDFTAVL